MKLGHMGDQNHFGQLTQGKRYGTEKVVGGSWETKSRLDSSFLFVNENQYLSIVIKLLDNIVILLHKKTLSNLVTDDSDQLISSLALI